MALVIFCVALVEAMRTRMSLSEAILSPPRRSDPRSDRKPPFRHGRLAMTANQANLFSSKRLGVTFDHRLELGGGVVGKIAAIADGIENIDMLAAEQRQQTVLEFADLADRNGVEIAVDAGVDHHDLLFHLQRRELRLLQESSQTRAEVEQALRRSIDAASELRERRHFAVLRQLALDLAGDLLHRLGLR